MEECSPARIGELLMEMLLIHMACNSLECEKTGISPLYQRLLESYGLRVNELETELLELKREGNKVQHRGVFKMDLIRRSGPYEERVQSKGIFTGIFNEGGAIRIEYSSDNFRMVSAIANMGTDTGNIIYQISEVTSGYGKTAWDSSLTPEKTIVYGEGDTGGEE